MPREHYCPCEVRCHRGKWVSKATFTRHKKRYLQHILMPLLLEEDIEEDSEDETADVEDVEQNGGSDDEMGKDLEEDISSLDPIIPDESPPRKKAKLTDDVYTEEDFDDFAVRLFYTCTFFLYGF